MLMVLRESCELEIVFFPFILTDWREAFVKSNIRDRIPGCETQV